MIEKDVNSEIKTVLLKRQFKINFIKQSLVLLTLGLVLVSGFFSTVPFVYAQSDGLRCEAASNGSLVEADKSQLYLDEEIRIYAKNPVSDPKCKAQQGNIIHYYEFVDQLASYSLYPLESGATTYLATYNDSIPGFESGQKYTGSFVAKADVNSSTKQKKIVVNVYSYISGAAGSKTALEGSFNIDVFYEKKGDRPEHAATTVKVVDSAKHVQGEGPKTYKFTDPEMALNISANTNYRLSLEEANQGGKFVRIYYSFAWVNSGNHPRFGVDKYEAGSFANTDPTMKAIYLGMNYDIPDIPQCGKYEFPTLIELKCSEGSIIDDLDIYHFNALPTIDAFVGVPWDNLLEDDFTAVGETSQTKGYRIFPIYDMDWGFYGHDINSTNDALKIDITVYKTTQAMLDACIKEHTDSGVTPEQAALNCADDKTLHTGLATSSSDTTPKDTHDFGTPIADFLAGIIGSIISWIQEIIYWIFGLVVLPLITTLLAVPTYTDNFAAVILPGWELLRNLANIFFILVLLVIGLGTLFRVQGYQYKNLLLKLIFAAFMVNFSLVLTQSFLAIAETAQFQFLPADDGGKVINVIANEIMIEPINQNVLTPDAASDNLSEGLSVLVFPFFYLSLTLMAFVVFCSLAFFLVLRMIVIWILLMASPLAIVSLVIPQTKSYFKTWFQYLVQYGFFVTILGFFLNVTAYLAQRQEGVLKSLSSPKGDPSLEEFLSRIATNLFVMGFLLAGLYVASKTKVIGAGQLNKIARKAGKLPFDFLKAAGERGLEGFQNKTNLTVDPRLWKKGYDSYLKEREKEKEERLKKRKMGKGGALGWVNQGVGSALSSPEQFLENFGSGKGWKTLGKKVKGSRFFGDYANKADEAEGIAKDTRDILTEGQRADKLEKLNELKNASASGEIAGGSKGAKSLASDLEKELEQVQKDLRASIKANDAGSGDPARVKIYSDLLAKEAALKNVRDKLRDESAGDLNDQALVDEIKGSVDDAVLDEFQKKIAKMKEDLKKDADKNTAEKDDLEHQIFEDDVKREKNGYSKFDKDGVDDENGYVAFTEEKREKLNLDAARSTQAKKSTEFKKLIKDSVETAKEQAKFMAEYKEQNVGADPASIVAQIEAERGKTDFSDRRAALLMLAAENGHMPAVIGMMGYDKSAEGFRKFRDEELKGQEKISEKATQALLAKLDEIHKRNGEHGLGFMTQRVGANIVYRSADSQAEAYGQAISKQSTREFLRGPETNLFTISNKGGKVEYSLNQVAKERFEAMDPSEAAAVLSGLPPTVKKKLMKTKEFKYINWKKRSKEDAKKGNKYESIEEALRESK